MATFNGNAAGYRVDFLDNGKIRVVDIDDSDGDTGKRIITGEQSLNFDDKTYELGLFTDIRVNTHTPSYQSSPAIATLAGGGFIITWSSFGQDGHGAGVYAQLYDAAGNAVGGETRVNTYTTSEQSGADVTGLTDGGFVITWSSFGQDGDGWGIYAQRYDAAGNAMGGEVNINTASAAHAVMALADGGYLLTWAAGDILAQRYDAAGNAVGDETRVSTDTGHSKGDPETVMLTDGGHVITWISYGQDGSAYGVYARQFDAAGNSVGGEFRVNTHTSSDQYLQAVTAMADGGYVIVWESWGLEDETGIYAQRYDAAGNMMGGETHVNTTTPSSQGSPDIATLADGSYVITWESFTEDTGGYEIYARRYGADGHAMGGETLINMATRYYQTDPAITALANGGYVISWTSGHDGSLDDINARYFDANGDSIARELILEGTDDGDVINGGLGGQLLVGLAGDDILSGGDGNDALEGGYHNDTLYGGKGNDNLYGEEGHDVLSGGLGDDALYASLGNDSLSGGAGNDFLEGLGGIDVLNGGQDNDILNGGRGSDTLTGGAGSDVFCFDSSLEAVVGMDTITDFSAAEGDLIQLENYIFKKLSIPGALNPGRFAANADGVAQDANDYIVYETDTGKLFYDVDGSGAGAKVQFAVLVGTVIPTLTAADFLVI